VKKVDYYFDFLSPYSYFSLINLDKSNFFKQYDVSLKPVVMGSLFNHFEMKGPGEILPKRHYMLKQCFIYAAQNNIPFNPPDKHPFNPLYALRLATKACSGDRQLEMIKLLFSSCWEKGLTLGEPEDLEPILEAHNFNAKEIIDKTFDRDVKKQLKQNTKDAIESNVFGVPSFVVDDNLFWGNDSIKDLNSYLCGNYLEWNEKLYKEKISQDQV
jgi:2-hydroxychromene-2-carboxylate isomerase